MSLPQCYFDEKFIALRNNVNNTLLNANHSDYCKLKNPIDLCNYIDTSEENSFVEFRKYRDEYGYISEPITAQECKDGSINMWNEDLCVFKLVDLYFIKYDTVMTDIFGEKEQYIDVDLDVRFGCVAYGFIIKNKDNR